MSTPCGNDGLSVRPSLGGRSTGFRSAGALGYVQAFRGGLDAQV
jgi:hypothetical protein